MVSLLVILLLA